MIPGTVRRTASGTAPGKVILSGEHAVVYGHPCVAAAINRGTTVQLRQRPGPTRAERSILSDRRLHRALLAVLPEEGVAVEIESSLPVGRGLGSSAALGIALVRAWAQMCGEDLDFAETHRRGFAVERVFHGNPSGVDHAVAALGTAVQYRMADGQPQLDSLSIPRLDLVILDSGRTGNTRRLVAAVAAQRPGIDPVLERIGGITSAFIEMLRQGAPLDVLGQLMSENHDQLKQLGVSTDNLNRLVRFALDAGAHGAKLAGAGGGGVVVALVDDSELLLRAAGKAGVPVLAVTVGG